MKQNTPWPFPTEHPSEGETQPTYVSIANIKAEVKRNMDIDRAEFLAKASDYGVSIVHIYDPLYPKGGLTVAFRKVNPYRSGVMVDVAVHTCSDQDSFSKKIGTAGALQKFFDGETISLPLLRTSDPSDINATVKWAFTSLYDAT